MREHVDVATRALCGAGAISGACLAGAVTLLLGGACLAYALVAPGLFGAICAAVVGAERLTLRCPLVHDQSGGGLDLRRVRLDRRRLVHAARAVGQRAPAAVVGCPHRRLECGGPSLGESGGVEPRMGAVWALGFLRGGRGTTRNAFRRDRRPARAGRCSRRDRANSDRRGQAPSGWQVPSCGRRLRSPRGPAPERDVRCDPGHDRT